MSRAWSRGETGPGYVRGGRFRRARPVVHDRLSLAMRYRRCLSPKRFLYPAEARSPAEVDFVRSLYVDPTGAAPRVS